MKILQSAKRFKIVAAGRRFGKSYLSAVTLLLKCLEDTNEHGYDLKTKEVWYVAPTFNQAKDIMWTLLKALGQGIIKQAWENTATLQLINGRYIKLKGSDRPDTLRGVGISYVVMDEYAFMKPDVWELIIRPTLADVKGEALFIGTPEGKNHFFDLYMAATEDDAWDHWQFNSMDNPFLDPAEIEHARNTMSSHAFRQEFEASFEAAGGGILLSSYLKFSEEEPDDGFFYIAVDPAGYEKVEQAKKSKLKRLDEMAIAIVKVHSGGWWVKEVDAGRWDVREASIRILKHARDVQAMRVGIESGALKNAIMPYLTDQMKRLRVFPKIVGVSHGGKRKEERISWALQGRFEHGRVILNRGEWNKKFVGQYMDFPNKMAHDDMLDALAYIDQVAITNYNSVGEINEWEPLDDLTGI